MKTLKMTLVLLLLANGVLFAQNDKDREIIRDAEKAKTAFIAENNNIATYFDNAGAYVIFPNVGKGALIVGAASGNGVVTHNGKQVGMANLKQVDVGLQAGGKTYSEVIFFETEEAFQHFTNNEFEFAAGASAVALKSGEAVNAEYRDGVAVYALPKAGLMAEASVGGQKFEYYPFTHNSNNR
jgi:lipid-binding SYLF domain-containing protein